MKTQILTSLLFLAAFLTPTAAILSQNATEVKTETLVSGPQSVTNMTVTNSDVLVISGRITDAETGEPITNARINFNTFGEELLQASIDEKGNYAIALNKNELGEPMRVIFKISGYKKFVIKSVDKRASYLEADIVLEPLDSAEKSNANIKYTLREDPFNTMVIKMQ